MTGISLWRRLARNRSGVAMTEFALGAPFLLMAGLWGAEEANFALTTMKINQLAIHLADNASRVGDTSTLQDRKIYESDINEVLYGAQLQGGVGIDLYAFGRVFISSVEVVDNGGLPASGTDNQYIHWQRCRGAKSATSSYGDEGDNLGTAGIGPAGEEVFAQSGDAVIFVEINYTYQPLVSRRFIGNPDIRAVASFTVRDDRDLTQIYQRDPADPDPIQRCNTLAGRMIINSDGSITDGGGVSTSTSTSTSGGSSTGGGSTTTSGGATSSTSGGATSSTTSGGSSTTSGGATSTTTGGASSTTTSGGASSGGASSGGASSGGRGGGRP